MTTEELIAALERATGPSRELDQQIATAALGWKLWRSKHGYWNLDGPDGERHSTFGRQHPPRFNPDTGEKNPSYDAEPLLADEAGLPTYTSSIDAALTLVPEGRYISLEHLKKYGFGDGWEACLDVANDFDHEHRALAEAATPALALCIAALKVRSA